MPLHVSPVKCSPLPTALSPLICILQCAKATKISLSWLASLGRVERSSSQPKSGALPDLAIVDNCFDLSGEW